MKLSRKSKWLLLLLVIPFDTALSHTGSHYNMVFETPEVTIAAGVSGGLTATFFIENSYRDKNAKKLGTIFPASNYCIYTKYNKWPNPRTKVENCSSLGAWLDRGNGLQKDLQQNYTKLLSQPFQGALDIFFGALQVKLSPVRAGHKLSHNKVRRKSGAVTTTSPPYIPEGQVTSDTEDGGYEIFEIISCDKNKEVKPRSASCKKGAWLDAGTIGWPGNLQERKLNINVESLDDGGMILTFYDFPERKHGLDIYTYDFRGKSEDQQYRDLRIIVKSDLLQTVSTSEDVTEKHTENATGIYNDTSAKYNNTDAPDTDRSLLELFVGFCSFVWETASCLLSE